VRLGSAAYAFDAASTEDVLGAVGLLERDLPAIDDRFLSARGVRNRLREVGIVPRALAEELGLVGLSARASGITVDQRAGTGGIYEANPVEQQAETAGDGWARARIRVHEMQASLRWIRALLRSRPVWRRERVPVGAFAPAQLAVALVEGSRGEVVHCVETDSRGEVVHYKVQDPSFRNWMGLAMAVRGTAISDFPICNKSFDLSYCGHDL
jgi:hypothetical protein